MFHGCRQYMSILLSSIQFFSHKMAICNPMLKVLGQGDKKDNLTEGGGTGADLHQEKT